MFRHLTKKTTKISPIDFSLENVRRLRNILYKSSWSKKSPPSSKSSKNTNKDNREVFFPPVRTEGIIDKVALVTGGSEGIGLRCVRELLSSGAKGVMIADTNETKGFNRVMEFSKEYGRNRVAFIQINPANYVLLKNAFISTINFYKGLDIVINSVKFKDINWEDQVDENIKGIVLSTQLCLEFMGRNNGGKGGILLNIASDHQGHSESCPLHLAVQDFIVRFDRSIAAEHFDSTNIKILTICEATFDSIGCDLATMITKGPNGCVWKPS